MRGLPGLECHGYRGFECDRDYLYFLPTRPPPPRLPGLPDFAYRHDGQLTKREVRAITLAALAPLPGQLLWDVGAGCGSIGIEWMRSDRRCQSIAIEQHPTRLQYIADNATALGTPHLKIVAGKAPSRLQDLPQPMLFLLVVESQSPNF